jgi:hypothetical protein
MKIPIACSLPADDMGDRLHEWEVLLAKASAREPTLAGYRLTFAPDAELAGALADLAAREIECCPFFTFAIRLTNDALQLDVEAPPEARALVDSLFKGDDSEATGGERSVESTHGQRDDSEATGGERSVESTHGQRDDSEATGGERSVESTRRQRDDSEATGGERSVESTHL